MEVDRPTQPDRRIGDRRQRSIPVDRERRRGAGRSQGERSGTAEPVAARREGAPRRSPAVRWLKQRLYSQHRGRYESLVRTTAASARRILVFGAGRGAHEIDLRGPGREVVGVDIDQVVRANPFLNRAVVYDGRRLPLPDATFDMCCSHSVIEHLSDPALSFAELARVTQPGGHLLFKTPNKWFYAMVISRLVPHRFHGMVVRFATGRDEEDTFPTLYRANTTRRLRRLLLAAGFIEVELHAHLHAGSYLAFSLPTYLLGVVYERIVNVSPLFEQLRGHIVGHFIRAPLATVPDPAAETLLTVRAVGRRPGDGTNAP